MVISKIIRVNHEKYKIIKNEEKLQCDQLGYFNVINEILDSLIEENENYFPYFEIFENGLGILNIINKTKFKNILILKIKFNPFDDEIIRKNVSYRFGSLNCKVSLMEDRINDIINIVKQKNPGLKLEIEKILKK